MSPEDAPPNSNTSRDGTAGTMTHDYERHGTTTLFAAMNVLDGTVIGRNMQRHRHQEFIRFLNVVEKQVPAGKMIHAIVDNYAAHKHPNVRRWLERHPRWTFHFTPTSASWLNAVEGFFATLTRRRLKRGVFRSVADLQAAINRFLEDHNQQSQTLHLDRRSRQNHRRRQARAPSARFDPLSCSPFQVAGTRMLCSRASGSEWPRLSRAGGTIIKTTVDHALMRGLDTAGPVMRRGASSV